MRRSSTPQALDHVLAVDTLGNLVLAYVLDRGHVEEDDRGSGMELDVAKQPPDRRQPGREEMVDDGGELSSGASRGPKNMR